MNKKTLYTAKTMARMLDVTERRIRQMKDEGIIAEYEGRPGLYDLVSTTHRYINYLRGRNPDNAEIIDYKIERAKLMRAKRRNEEYDLQVKERELHATADIEAVVSGTLITFKTRLMAIPAKLSPVLSKKTKKSEIHRILKEAVDEALAELADFNKVFKEGGEEQDENVDT